MMTIIIKNSILGLYLSFCNRYIGIKHRLIQGGSENHIGKHNLQNFQISTFLSFFGAEIDKRYKARYEIF